MKFLLSLLSVFLWVSCGDSVSKGGGTEVEGVIYATLAGVEDSTAGTDSVKLFRFYDNEWNLEKGFSEASNELKITFDSDWFTLQVENEKLASFYGPFHPSWNVKTSPISLVLRKKITVCLPNEINTTWSLFSPVVEVWSSNGLWACLDNVMQGYRVLEKKEDSQVSIVGLNLHTYLDTVFLPSLASSDFYIPSFIYPAKSLALPNKQEEQIDYLWVDLVKGVDKPTVLKSFYVMYDSNAFIDEVAKSETFNRVQKLVSDAAELLNSNMNVNFFFNAPVFIDLSDKRQIDQRYASYAIYLSESSQNTVQMTSGVPVFYLNLKELGDSTLVNSFVKEWAVIEGAPQYQMFIPDDSKWNFLIPDNLYDSAGDLFWDDWSRTLLEVRRNSETPSIPSWMILWLDKDYELEGYNGGVLSMTKYDIKANSWTTPVEFPQSRFTLKPSDFITSENTVYGLIRIYSDLEEWVIPYWFFSLAQYEDEELYKVKGKKINK